MVLKSDTKINEVIFIEDMSIHNAQNKKEFRKELRNNPTDQEKVLWLCLRNSQLGYKFRRQQSIGGFIVDFYCPEKLLVIEVDGSSHLENKEYDQERTNYLHSLNITVLRFWNNEIIKNIDEVIMVIQEVLKKSNVRYFLKEKV